MKKLTLILFFVLAGSAAARCDNAGTDELLRNLNEAIDNQAVYTDGKKAEIEVLRQRKLRAQSTEDIYAINREIIGNYESFICDSAEYYIRQNLRIARKLGNRDYISECELQLAFIYSLSGLFLQANDIGFHSVDNSGCPVIINHVIVTGTMPYIKGQHSKAPLPFRISIGNFLFTVRYHIIEFRVVHVVGTGQVGKHGCQKTYIRNHIFHKNLYFRI